MAEKKNLLLGKTSRGSSDALGLQRIWNSPHLSFLHGEKTSLQKDMLNRKNSHASDIDVNATAKTSYHALSSSGTEDDSIEVTKSPLMVMQNLLLSGLAGAPALVIAILLNLFFGVSFGQVFFPTSWTFPDGVPRAIGVQVKSCRSFDEISYRKQKLRQICI